MSGNKGDDEHFDLATPEIDEVSEPKTKQAPQNPNKHLGRIDPVLMEKLSQIDPPADSKGSKVKYVDGVPVFNQRRETSSLVSTLAFLLTVLVGYGALRMYLGEPIVPLALKEVVFGKEEVIIPPPAKITINTKLVGYEVSLNGVKQNLFNNQFEVPAGNENLTLVVSRVGYSTFTTKILPVSGTSIVVKPELRQQLATGFLSYETVPAAKLTLYQGGKKVAEYTTPIRGEKVPVGIYQAVLENSFIGFRKEQVITVEEWKTTNFRLDLGSGTGASVALPSVNPIAPAQ